MSKASKILEDLQTYKLYEYQATQNYHVVRFADRDNRDIAPLFSGSYEDCISYRQIQGNPDLVVIDDSGIMKPDQGSFQGNNTNEPQTFVSFETSPLQF